MPVVIKEAMAREIPVVVLERSATIGGLSGAFEFHPGYRLPGVLHDEGLVSRHLFRNARAGMVVGLEALGGDFTLPAVRPRRVLFVSGGSHAGNVGAFTRIDRQTPGSRVHLVPLEPIAADPDAPRFAISAPWRKRVWLDPEAEGTD